MTNILPQPVKIDAKESDMQELADDSMYRSLALMFLIGIALLFVFFILMLVILAGAS